MFHILPISVNGFDHNLSYILWEEESFKGAIIDPTGDFEIFCKALRNLPENLDFSGIFLTHGHKDHSENLEKCQALFGIGKVMGHEKNPFVNTPLKDGEKVFNGKGFLTVFHTPGHSGDSISLLTSDHQSLFTGDTLFIDYCGFARDENALFHSLRKLASLPAEANIYSGHDYGKVLFRQLEKEKHSNLYLKAALESREAFSEALKHLE